MASVYEGAYGASPSATANYSPLAEGSTGLVARLAQLNGWTVALTVLLGLVAYDQCM